MKSDGSNQQLPRARELRQLVTGQPSIAFQRSASGTGLSDQSIAGRSGSTATSSSPGCAISSRGCRRRTSRTTRAKVDVDPDWSNDGQKIVFTSINEGDHPQTPTSAEIWTINPDGNGLTRLTFNEVEERAPAWSPDGTRITYMCKQGTVPPHSDNEICVMNADGTDQTQLTDNGLNDATPTFSPDGQKILFHRGGGGLGTGTHLLVMNLDGTGQTQITFLPGSSQYANWGFVRR